MIDANDKRLPIDYVRSTAVSEATRHFVLVAWCCWAASIGACVLEELARRLFQHLVATGASSYDDLYDARLAGEEARASAALVLMLVGGLFAYIAQDAGRPRARAALIANSIGTVGVIIFFLWTH